jgi:hypothetical protein
MPTHSFGRRLFALAERRQFDEIPAPLEVDQCRNRSDALSCAEDSPQEAR